MNSAVLSSNLLTRNPSDIEANLSLDSLFLFNLPCYHALPLDQFLLNPKCELINSVQMKNKYLRASIDTSENYPHLI